MKSFFLRFFSFFPINTCNSFVVCNIIGAPIFIEPPTGLTITKGDLAKLVCYVQGDPFPKVTWLFENRTLEASDTVSFRFVV